MLDSKHPEAGRLLPCNRVLHLSRFLLSSVPGAVVAECRWQVACSRGRGVASGEEPESSGVHLGQLVAEGWKLMGIRLGVTWARLGVEEGQQVALKFLRSWQQPEGIGTTVWCPSRPSRSLEWFN
ncbi:hypothetical protein F511_23557 [Dorcoceras hygrometricum]|uniref:Uncharacterized protein n=1 Tax=Dorcoceras hygrometricum TaxID=472368 RepID=A0A2Z7B4H9_9LAMI|nr:hypothetical protein F511_23557 [Dorcoceras hygrometricum]